MKLTKLATRCFLVVAALTLAGCQETVSPDGVHPAATTDEHPPHAHPSEGPHHGDLVELGDEQYHAEVVHNDDAGTLEVYILDSAAINPVAIEATELTINATHHGQPEQFTLTAKPEESDEAGKSSRFYSEDKELAHHLDEEGFQPKLVVRINGKSYRGEIKHDHDDSSHGHTHDTHEGHDHDKPDE